MTIVAMRSGANAICSKRAASDFMMMGAGPRPGADSILWSRSVCRRPVALGRDNDQSHAWQRVLQHREIDGRFCAPLKYSERFRIDHAGYCRSDTSIVDDGGVQRPAAKIKPSGFLIDDGNTAFARCRRTRELLAAYQGDSHCSEVTLRYDVHIQLGRWQLRPDWRAEAFTPRDRGCGPVWPVL